MKFDELDESLNKIEAMIAWALEQELYSLTIAMNGTRNFILDRIKERDDTTTKSNN